MMNPVKKQQIFIFIWIICAIVAGWFYFNWHITNEYVGLVEAVTHNIGARESGIIQDMYVSIQDEVQPGQILAVLDTSDLDQELNILRADLDRMIQLVSADRQRYSLELQRLQQQLDRDIRFDAELEAKKAELAGLNAEISRLEEARKAGLGHSRDLSELIVKRNALRGFLKIQQSRQEKVPPSKDTFDTETYDVQNNKILDSLMAESQEKISLLKHQITGVENRYNLRKIIAPCHGKIVELFARSGDTIEEYSPVIAITENRSDFLNVYIPEKSDFDIKKGMHVNVFPVRSKMENTEGSITFIHPGYTRVPERLTVRGQALWAHVVRVTLNDDHTLLPGEIVHVRIPEENKIFTGITNKAAAKPSPVSTNPIIEKKQITIPENLKKMTRFEPSGIVYLESEDKYLVISDDTGLPDASTDHKPWLFYMNRSGQIEPEPVLVEGVTSFNDIEAITSINNHTFLLISSQNISKNGKRKNDRTMLYEIIRNGQGFKAIQKVSLLNTLMNSYTSEEISILGLSKLETDNQPELNIEAAVHRNNTLFIGLKEPSFNNQAIIWRLSNLDRFLQTGKLTTGQLTMEGTVSFADADKMTPGISDMTIDKNGRFWILTTIPNASDENQMGRLHCLKSFSDNRMIAETVLSFPTQKPEGLCFTNDNELLVVIDADEKNPELCRINLEKLR